MSRLLISVFIALLAAAFAPALHGAELTLEQQYVVGFPIEGIRGVVPYDLPGEVDSRLLIIHPTYLLGLQWMPRQHAYEQTFFTEGSSFFGTAVFADVTGDGVDDLVVPNSSLIIHPGNMLFAYDARTGALLKSLPLPANLTQLAAQNLDGAPGEELLVADADGLSAYKGGSPFWHAALPSVAVLPSEGDVVFARLANEVLRLDPRTGAELRRMAMTPQCRPYAIGQLDADASPEVLCTGPPGLQVVDVDTGAEQWERPAPAGMPLDVDGDGRQEVVLRQDGNIVVLSGGTGQRIADRPQWLQETGLLAAVSTGCGSALLVTDFMLSDHADALYRLDPRTLETESVTSFDRFRIEGMAVGDLDGDGRNELIVHHDAFVSTWSFQPLHATPPAVRGAPCCSFAGMAVGQLDADRAMEYVLGDLDGSVGILRAFDGATHEPMWTARLDSGETSRFVEIGDVNGDGRNDVVTATQAFSSGAKGTFVYAFDGATGKPLWRSVNIPFLRGRIRIGDVDGDGAPDVVALSRTIGIIRLGGATGRVLGFDEFPDGGEFAVLNIDDDPQAEILVLAPGRFFVLDGGVVTYEGPLPAGALMELGDLDGDGIPEILHFGETIQVRDARTLKIRATFATPLSFNAEMRAQVADMDGDGTNEVVVQNGLTVRIFRIGPRPADPVPPRFRPGSSVKATATTRAGCCNASVSLQWDAAEADDSVRYELWRAAAGSPAVLLGTTRRNTFDDGLATGSTLYRYSVRAVDAAGNGSEPLETAVTTGETICHRRRSATR